MRTSCQSCGRPIDEAEERETPRKPCPRCGCTKQSSNLDCADAMVAADLLAVKDYAAGKSRKKGLRKESKDGASFSQDRQRFMQLHQLVDHESKRYVKTVTDPKTGEVIRHVDEPLPDHTGRGSAKDRDT